MEHLLKMKRDCEQCKSSNRRNNKYLDALSVPITYDSSRTIVKFSLPRKYTTTHDDTKKETYISVGKTYNQNLLNTDEVKKVQSQVIGKWIKNKNSKYEIHFKVLVSTPENPLAFIRNKIFCEEMWRVLKGVALSESSILKNYPDLAQTKIFIHFKSIDPKYNRVEYWKRLGYWLHNHPQHQPHRKQKTS